MWRDTEVAENNEKQHQMLQEVLVVKLVVFVAVQSSWSSWLKLLSALVSVLLHQEAETQTLTRFRGCEGTQQKLISKH